jgi:phosphatidylserine decarboxylase
MSESSWRVFPQYLLPQHLLTAGMYALTRWRWTPFKDFFIRVFIQRYNVDMSLAGVQDFHHYQSFNEFFTRALKPGARPVAAAADSVVCPVDGVISQIGDIHDTFIFQAKGHGCNLAALLAGDAQLAERFRHGRFATLYLSPRDYHRVHMPVAGRLTRMIYVPGRLFSVNRATTQSIPGLFARNERVINIFDTAAGLMAVILVGAIFVGSMETVWTGQITPAPLRRIRHWDYLEAERAVTLERGQELGRFNMGSTVILLFEPGRIEWLAQLQADAPVVMGQEIGRTATSG